MGAKYCQTKTLSLPDAQFEMQELFAPFFAYPAALRAVLYTFRYAGGRCRRLHRDCGRFGSIG